MPLSSMSSVSASVSELSEYYGEVMLLNVYVVPPEDKHNMADLDVYTKLRGLYVENANKTNAKLLSHVENIDAGVDLFLAKELANSCGVVKADHNVICSAQMYVDGKYKRNTGYCLYPRSSIIKSQYRLANSVGVIDAGYRGHIISAFDCFCTSPVVSAYERLTQLCSPSLCPIYVNIVDSVDGLGVATERGSGGFGSTGR